MTSLQNKVARILHARGIKWTKAITLVFEMSTGQLVRIMLANQ